MPAPNASDSELLQEWSAAKSKLGPPIPRAGAPDVREFAPAEVAYIRELCAQPWVQAMLKKPAYQEATFKLVEIGPLLAHQPFIDLERVDYSPRTGTPAVSELMPICLPRAQPKPLEPPTVTSQNRHSIIIKSRKAHVEAFAPSLPAIEESGYEHTLAGVDLHWRVPFVNVVHLGGRYVLRTGYHRTFAAAKSGATHIPCLVRQLSNSDGAEASSDALDWLMMPRRVLESSNPPTVAHFVKGCAHKVMLRATSLVVQVTWSCHIMPDDYEGL